MNYFDILLAKKLEDDRDPKVEGLSVTENGRYHEDGVVYDPVIVALPLDSKTITSNGTYKASDDNLEGYDEVNVNVPLPENAYLLKSVSGLPQPIATFTDGSNLPMPKFEVGIEPVQDLHGYDAPWVGGAGKNKCPINSGTITVGDFVTFSTPLPSGTYSISLKATRTPSSGSYASLVAYDKDDVAYSSIIGIASNKLDGNIIKSEAMVFNNGLSKIYVYSIAGQWSESRNYTLTISDLQIEQGSTATTFAPYSNICPISGWSAVDVSVIGKNRWGKGNINGVSTYDVTGLYIPIGTWTLSANVTSDDTSSNNCLIYDLTQDHQGALGSIERGNRKYITFTTDHVITSIRVYASTGYNPSQGHVFTFTDIQLEEGSVATEYEPYNGHTYTIPFTDSQGQSVTVYKGAIDVVNGSLDDVGGVINLGERTYKKSSDGYFYAFVTDISFLDFDKTHITAECEIYKLCSYSEWTNKEVDNAFFGNNISHVLYIADSRFTDADDLKAALNGVKLVYTKTTSTTYPQQPTAVKALQGINNVFADSGDVLNAEYFSREE